MNAPVPAHNLDALRRQHQGLQLRFAALQGQARELQTQHTTLAKSIALAKARIELAPQVTEAFDFLQEKAHAKAVGDFEDLLTAFVEDVVPESGGVLLQLGTERGAPALDIVVENNGNEEDLDGNGGGLNNVVVTGLVFAAQSRTRNRRLVVLDEPDCWLKGTTRVPAFTKVIADVATPQIDEAGRQVGGCQTLMISHNDISLMDPRAHVFEIVDEDGVPTVVSRSGAKAWDDDVQEGLRWIEVTDLRRHHLTRVELSPGLNVLTGDINTGKSHLFVTALRMLAYNDVTDHSIRHGQDAAVVRVGLENGIVLEAVRRRKGAPKMTFRRYVGGASKPTNEASPSSRGEVPDFITRDLRISRVDGLDIQLRRQKRDQLFLLDETPAVRAKLLSVGREAGLLQAMIEQHRLELRRDRESVKREEVDLNQLSCKLRVLAPLSGIAALVEIILGMQGEAQAAADALARTKTLVARLSPLEARVRLLAPEESRLATPLTAPVLPDTNGLKRLVARLEAVESLARLPSPAALPATPVVTDTAALQRLVARLAAVEQLARLPLPRELPAVPAIQDTAPLRNLLIGLRKNTAYSKLLGHVPAMLAAPTLTDVQALLRQVERLALQEKGLPALETENKAAVTAEQQAKDALHAYEDELGVCPTCSKPFKEEAHV